MSVETELQARTPGRRLIQLDALRGLAAFVVIWHHFRLAFHDYEPVWYLRPLFAGKESVILFFVLSGYVLSLPVWNGRQPGYGRYIVRRFFRIYVPYAAAVLVSIAGAHHFLFAQKPLSQWFYETWHTPLTRQLILAQFFTMALTPELSTAYWSLRYEMEMSFVMPFLSRAIRRAGTRVVILSGLATMLLFKVISHVAKLHLLDKHPIVMPIALTVLYGLCFVLGALLSLHRDAIGEWYKARSPGFKICGLIVTVVAFYSGDVLTILASAGIIVFALYSQVQHWLDTPIPEYLGRISYSLYLIHGTVLFALLILLVGRLPVWSIAVIFLVTALIAAHLFCVLVEEPALRLGKRITAR